MVIKSIIVIIKSRYRHIIIVIIVIHSIASELLCLPLHYDCVYSQNYLCCFCCYCIYTCGSEAPKEE